MQKFFRYYSNGSIHLARRLSVAASWRLFLTLVLSGLKRLIACSYDHVEAVLLASFLLPGKRMDQFFR